MKTIAIVVVVLLLVLAYLLVTSSDPALFSYVEPGDPTGEPVWIILHPLRDRAPERVAAAVLNDLRDSRVEEASRRLRDPRAFSAETRARERQHPLRSWRLVNRLDSPDTVRLSYMCARGDSSDRHSPLWITLVKSGSDEEWVVDSLVASY
jgi:hypothetical protein